MRGSDRPGGMRIDARPAGPHDFPRPTAVLKEFCVSIADSLVRVQEEISAGCAACGRRVDEITLVAVSKTVSASAIREAHAAGARNFGENRVQELTGKGAELRDLELTWHLVGSLQTNKVRLALPHLGLLHSLDRPSLAEAVNRHAAGPADALLQVNTTGEASKSGVAPDDLFLLTDQVRALPRIRLQGLMTIGPLGGDEEEIRSAFALLYALRERVRARHPDLALPVLSMGMSDDFPLAIREGSTMVRIGSRIFGARPAPTLRPGAA
jgi:pyridoxal phosphate enzyme (YggS family)